MISSWHLMSERPAAPLLASTDLAGGAKNVIYMQPDRSRNFQPGQKIDYAVASANNSSDMLPI
jgi:hypothetical protein